MMPIVDASVMVRYLIGDDEELAERAEKIFNEGCATTTANIVEAVRILEEDYQVPHDAASTGIASLLDYILVDRGDGDCVAQALRLHGERGFALVQALVIAQHRMEGRDVITFDEETIRELAGEAG